MTTSNTIENKYDFVFIFDVKNGNPNGDPDNGNAPRIDVETGKGYVTDVCLKRKSRNYVQITKDKNSTDQIFIKSKAILNNQIEEAHEDEIVINAKDKEEAAREYLCKRYWDVRTFGAVLSTGTKKANNVHGAIQVTFSDSIDPIYSDTQHTITRCCRTTIERAEKGGESEIGEKHAIHYAAYMGYGFVSANLANKSWFTEDDLNLFFESFKNMFELDRAAARGLMTMRKMYIFKHDNKYGNANSADLFDLIEIKKNKDVVRDWKDYDVKVGDVKTISNKIEMTEY